VPKVFRTTAEARESVTIVGVGVLGPEGSGAISVESAAEVMPELQNDDGQPLKGSELTDAAKEWAEAHDLRVVDLSEKKLATVQQDELGVAAERPPASEVAEQEYAATYGGDTTVDVAHEEFAPLANDVPATGEGEGS
jgi:hypothetical protein